MAVPECGKPVADFVASGIVDLVSSPNAMVFGITERFGVAVPTGRLIRDSRRMPHGASKPVEPHPADRQPRRTNEPEADFEIAFVNGADGEALARQQVTGHVPASTDEAKQ
ncbi:hypothetical protein [Nocardia sp. Marseille-Q1738]